MKQLARALAPNRDARFDILNRWTFVMSQGFEAKTFLDLAQNKFRIHEQSTLEEMLTQQAHFRAFLLSYGKCFTASGKNRSSLNPSKVFAGQSQALIAHKRILDLRHKFAAHNDSSGLDEAVIEVQEFPKEFLISNRYALANPLHEYENYRTALKVLEKYIVVQVERTIASLEKTLQKKIRVIEVG